MFKKRLLTSLAVAGSLTAVGLLFPAPRASAATVPAAGSANWSGYVANASSGSAGFSRVSGSWVQPSADPSAGDGDSAFWVGLGGGSGQTNSLEQIGTEANVTNGQTEYNAWYELVPAAQVKLNLAIHPGDHMSASVAVSGSNVTVSLSDQTTGQSYTKTLQMSNPDSSTAEWIAEAPSESDGQGDFQPLPLANFGTVGFTNSSATAEGHTGTISDSSWSAQPVALDQSSAAGAQPSSLSSDGSSFSVAWQAGASGSSGQVSSSGGDGSQGYGDGGDGGYGGYGGGGYGYDDGGGYGYGGYGGDGGGGYGGYGYSGYSGYAYSY
jgi:hypothetical protein